MIKDLGEEIENMEESIENLKKEKFHIFGFRVSFMSVSALIAIVGTILGTLYAGFIMYQKVEQAIAFVEQQEEYEAKINAYDNRMKIMETKVEDTVEYTRDIKED